MPPAWGAVPYIGRFDSLCLTFHLRAKGGTLAAVVDDRRDDRVTVARNIAVLNLTPESHESRRSLLSADHALREPLHVRLELFGRYMADCKLLSVLDFCQ